MKFMGINFGKNKVRRIPERKNCKDSYLTLEHLLISINQEVLDNKLDELLKRKG
jgi:hypothetical protein